MSQQYDNQGKLFHHYVKVAGWDNKRTQALLVKRFGATHWNALNHGERRTALAIMRSYAEKAGKAAMPRLRQRIVAIVNKNGQNIDWLHDTMEVWGYGRSLRKLNYAQTLEVLNEVRNCFNPGGTQ